MSAPPGPTIRTARLDLVPLAVEHATEMAIVLDDPSLHDFTGGRPRDPQALGDRYARLVAGSGEPGVSWRNWVLRSRADDRLVGYVQATITSTAEGVAAEIAWVIGTRWQGSGFAKEAAAALVQRLRDWRDQDGTPVRIVVAHVHPEHRASAAVARAAGLRATERVKDGEVRWERQLRPAP